MPSYLLNNATLDEAIDLLEPSILKLLEKYGRNVVCIVVLDPLNHRKEFEKVVGETDREKWANTFMDNAHKKAKVAARTGYSNHILQRVHPHLFQKDDFKYYGGVNHDGIIVGVSGLKEHQDLMVAGWVATTLKAICMGIMEVILAQKSRTVELDK